MSTFVTKYGRTIGLIRHSETSDMEVYDAEGKWLGAVLIRDTKDPARVREILKHWTGR